MKTIYTKQFLKDYAHAPPEVQKACEKQLGFLLHNLKHPSLHAKKYDESRDRWQARVNRSWRLFFKIEGDAYVLTDLTPHP